jgi:hypothetical protein
MRNIILVGLLVLLLGLGVGCSTSSHPSDSYQIQSGSNTTFIWYQPVFSAEQLDSLGIIDLQFGLIEEAGNVTRGTVIIEFASTPSEETLAQVDSMLPHYIREGSPSIWEKFIQLEARVAALENP